MNPARIVLIDDPTPYKNRHNIRKDGGKTRFGTGVDHKYSLGTMTEQELIDLGPRIQAICAPDAYVMPWVTKPNLPMGIRILEARGLFYKTTLFEWEKLYPDASSFKGTGRYTFSNLEALLLGRYPGAKCWHPKTGYKPQMLQRTTHPRYLGLPHSRKPEVIQDEIEKWLGPYIGDYTLVELFATRQRPGWTCLGYDVTGRDIRDDLDDLAFEMSLAEIWRRGKPKVDRHQCVC